MRFFLFAWLCFVAMATAWWAFYCAPPPPPPPGAHGARQARMPADRSDAFQQAAGRAMSHYCQAADEPEERSVACRRGGAMRRCAGRSLSRRPQSIGMAVLIDAASLHQARPAEPGRR